MKTEPVRVIPSQPAASTPTEAATGMERMVDPIKSKCSGFNTFRAGMACLAGENEPKQSESPAGAFCFSGGLFEAGASVVLFRDAVGYLFFFSFLSFCFSLAVIFGCFLTSFLPLSRFPPSPMCLFLFPSIVILMIKDALNRFVIL
ncbi:MAG: hypothetical protein JXD22_07605 [Sedimentisphaerales bacterium]|nr:hypothetical protein [Sedimentisphaerales bacterium]